MKKTACLIVGSFFLISILACATGGDNKPSLDPKLLEVSKELGIENPVDYWTIDWKELDKDGDNFVSMEEVTMAYPEHGADAFPYFDTDGDGKISWEEHEGRIDWTQRQ